MQVAEGTGGKACKRLDVAASKTCPGGLMQPPPKQNHALATSMADVISEVLTPLPPPQQKALVVKMAGSWQRWEARLNVSGPCYPPLGTM